MTTHNLYTKVLHYSKQISRVEYVILCLIIICCGLRFYQLGHIPVSTYWDETAMLVDLKAVLSTGNDMHGLPWYQAIYPSYGDYKLPVYLWLSLVPAKLLGVTPFSLRLVGALTGVLTIIVAGMLARTLTQWLNLSIRLRRLIVLSAMLVVATSPWSFLFSRTAFEGHVSQLSLAFSVYCILTMSKQWWRGMLAGLFGAIAIYGYYASRYVWFPLWFLSVGLVFLQSKRQDWKKYLTSAVIGLGLCLLLLLPLYNSPWYQPMQQFRLGASSILNPPPDALVINQWREWSGNTIVSRVVFHRDWFLVRALASHYADHISLQTLFLQGDSNLRHSTTQHGLFLWPFVLSLIVGSIILLRKVRILLFLVAWWMLALLPASVPSDTPHALRSLNGLVPLSILMGIGTGVILYQLYSKRLVNRLLSATFLLGIFVAMFSFFQYYFHVYQIESAEAWQDGYEHRVNTLFANRQGSEPVWSLVPDQRFYLYLMAYGPFSGVEFAAWPEKNFEKQSGDELFFQSDQKEQFRQALTEQGHGLLLADVNTDIEVLKSELSAASISCQSYSSDKPSDTYRLCQVSTN